LLTAELQSRQSADRPRCVLVDVPVVMDHRHAVADQTDVQLDGVRAKFERGSKSGHGVPWCSGGHAAMGNDLELLGAIEDGVCRLQREARASAGLASAGLASAGFSSGQTTTSSMTVPNASTRRT